MTANRRPAPVAPSATSGWVVLLSVVAIVVALAAVAFTFLRTGTAATDHDVPDPGLGRAARRPGPARRLDRECRQLLRRRGGDSLVGPAAADGSAPDTVYLQVTCYGDDGHLAMTRSHQSALAAGATRRDRHPARRGVLLDRGSVEREHVGVRPARRARRGHRRADVPRSGRPARPWPVPSTRPSRRPARPRASPPPRPGRSRARRAGSTFRRPAPRTAWTHQTNRSRRTSRARPRRTSTRSSRR